MTFFKLVDTTITQLHALMGELTGTADATRATEYGARAASVAGPPIQMGHALVERAGGRTVVGTRAVQEKVSQSKSRSSANSGIQVTEMENLLTTIDNTSAQRGRQVREMFERDISVIYRWLSDVAEPFVRTNRDMGRTAQEVAVFIQRHQSIHSEMMVCVTDVS
jgi:hypothetical protein